jgi:predicted enzyme related to lactoylglutathione lyase
MRISHLRIWVDDMAKAKRFYGETLGLESPWNWGDSAIGFNLSDAQLIVEPDDGSHEDEKLSGRFVGCTIQVDDIDATYHDWTAKGVEFDGPPEDAPGIGRMTSFRDPAGNVFTLFGQLKAARVLRRKARRR